MEQVEGDRGRAVARRVELDRDRDEPERDAGVSECSGAHAALDSNTCAELERASGSVQVPAAKVAPEPAALPSEPSSPGSRPNEGMAGRLEVLGVVSSVRLAAAHVTARLADSEVFGPSARFTRLLRRPQAGREKLAGSVSALGNRPLHEPVPAARLASRSTKCSFHDGSSRGCAERRCIAAASPRSKTYTRAMS